MNFTERYAKLNKAQKKAVDTIEGPVMVIAGPGTGKTELLGVRAANILKKTDTLPENILCLTFTESGANAMRERLTEIIGKQAYKVAIHTFHSFGTEVINQNGQYFYQGAHFRAADGLSSYEIIHDIFEQLDYNNPIASKLNGEYTHLSDSLTAISELKKSGLTSDELIKIIDENNAVIEKVEQLLAPIFANRISKNMIAQLTSHIDEIRTYNPETILNSTIPLSKIIADSLEKTTNEALELNSTKPITAWRNTWFKKDNNGNFILKSHERQIKLRALSFVYEQYLSHMQEAALYDFDDMILRVVHAMEVFNDLRFNLQEKYQYIMVDEFQDTNMAQMRILHNLTNNEAHSDTPNIMVVGDDDQAIYSFQGANISNIINFKTNYPKTTVIGLTDNYRSTSDILSGSRNIILQGKERLENQIDGLSKELTACNDSDKSNVCIYEAETIINERHWLVDDIKKRIKSGQKPSDIAVLTRRHHEINSLLPYFHQAGINVSYERRDNVLDQAPIVLVEQLSRLLISLSKGLHDDVNALIPEVMTHKAWGIQPTELWKLSTKAYNDHTRWLDIMTSTPEFAPLHSWFVNTAYLINDTPLEQILDIIIGKPEEKDTDNTDFVSPLYNYFFSNEKLTDNPDKYLTYLESLRTIRSKLREYRPDQTPTLNTFIDFIALNRKIGSTINVVRPTIESGNAINIMTAHKSKGLEFDTVYVVNAIDTVWGERARSRNRLINYPENLPISPAGENEDERLRLFYVAITRAKRQLYISHSLSDNNSKSTLKASFLLDSKWPTKDISSPNDINQVIEATELAWYQPLINPINTTMNELLLPMLENYKLSVTHLHNFLDVSRGGPAMFLLQNILRFPSAKSPNAAFGTAIHDTLQRAHSHLSATGKKQAIEDIVSNFESILTDQHISKHDFDIFSQKGSDALRTFLDNNYQSFTTSQQTELSFASQHSIVNDAHLTGKLDLADIDKTNKTITVTDYKTGKPSLSWSGKTDYEKIKLHKYKQQLMFYKLLVENSRDFHNYKVDLGIMQFVEPTISGDNISLEETFNSEELERFSKLINAVWAHIIKLDLPDISDYELSYRGILAFEQNLIDNAL
ncbi:MAG: ATP-dependent helicase UvrD/PcrA [Patescibacteria group bacterium]|nr:ATP-dependent helicase UvrD/PcrA [Patescibacteria group bacterium]